MLFIYSSLPPPLSLAVHARSPPPPPLDSRRAGPDGSAGQWRDRRVGAPAPPPAPPPPRFDFFFPCLSFLRRARPDVSTGPRAAHTRTPPPRNSSLPSPNRGPTPSPPRAFFPLHSCFPFFFFFSTGGGGVRGTGTYVRTPVVARSSSTSPSSSAPPGEPRVPSPSAGGRTRRLGRRPGGRRGEARRGEAASPPSCRPGERLAASPVTGRVEQTSPRRPAAPAPRRRRRRHHHHHHHPRDGRRRLPPAYLCYRLPAIILRSRADTSDRPHANRPYFPARPAPLWAEPPPTRPRLRTSSGGRGRVRRSGGGGPGGGGGVTRRPG